MGKRQLVWVAALWWFIGNGWAAGVGDAGAVPHLSAAGQEDYRQFLAAPRHRAFAIAPGGAWGWKGGEPSAEAAREAALEACGGQGHQKCVPYVVDDRVVFDAKTWPTLWGPYLKAKAAAKAPVGELPGERFPDLAFRDPAGKPLSVRALAGKVVVLHFWGSWCGPCRREMPDLEKLHDRMSGQKDVVFVLLQVREPIAVARQWGAKQGIHLPLHDSGSTGESTLPLVGGGTINDREIAMVFPTTYVLDKHGVVLFSHVGPVSAWPDYEPFLKDAAARSGR